MGIMGILRIAEKVCLISAVCYQKDVHLDDVLQKMTETFGTIDEKSDLFTFTHTQYYLKEMGKELFKFFCSFKALIDPMEIVSIKLESNRIENFFSKDTKRSVNIDPGYIETPKLVLATTKNYGHRIYLGQGIYGDVQLYWRNGAFRTNPWTYPDYREMDTVNFFTKVRKNYLSQKGEA